MVELDDDGTHSRRYRSSGHGFSDSLWGARARALVESTRRFGASHWVQIEALASVYFQGADHDDEQDKMDAAGSGVQVDMYAQIEIDWCVRLTFHSVSDTNFLLELVVKACMV